MISYQTNLNFDASAHRQNWACLQIKKYCQNFFCVTLTETFVCSMIRSWVIQVYTIHTSSQLLSVCSISAHIQLILKKYHHLVNLFITEWVGILYPFILAQIPPFLPSLKGLKVEGKTLTPSLRP